MAKSKKTKSQKAEPGNSRSPESGGTPSEPSKDAPKDGIRETVESIAVAFILAFLFRTFEAEAFVIPTGSMAPTLYGRHKDVDCPKCAYHFTVGASDEVNNDGMLKSGKRIKTALCPNCRFQIDVRNNAVFKGDRILVNKFPFEVGIPERWDVTVFKYPEEPATNYIKRLVGLPNETILIRRGDLYRIEPSGERQILRKDDANKQQQLQIDVYDYDHPERALHERGWPTRWAPVERNPDATDAIAGWSLDTQGWESRPKTSGFVLSPERAQDGNTHWLRYRNIVPGPDDWRALESGNNPLEPPMPELITDFCSYNAYTGGDSSGLFSDAYWVGDLTVSGEVFVDEATPDGELVLELNEGSRRYRCRFELATGRVALSQLVDLNRDDEESRLTEADARLTVGQAHHIRFANVDDRLSVWVDERLIDFQGESSYAVPETTNPSPQTGDLIPVGIAAKGAAVRVSHLLLKRDIYYRAETLVRGYDNNPYPPMREECSSQDVLRTKIRAPYEWYEYYAANRQEVLLELGEDEFLMLGDNSPRSRDSRLWPNTRHARHRHAVPGSALVGKAFFIYWPHGVPFLNDGQGFTVTWHDSEKQYPRLRVPFYPQVGRMRRIR